MPEQLLPYSQVVYTYLVLGVLLLTQVLVADVASIRAGHVPGMPVNGGHDVFLFRAVRAHANTNENVPLFLLASATAILSGASPGWSTWFCWTFVLARFVHMLAYYADLRLLRSGAFALGLVASIGLLVLAALALA